MSLLYTESNLPTSDKISPVLKFNATSLEIWNTTPSRLDGVKYWSQIAAIDIYMK
jgi:hypothetical protein